jgi:hypothetical protein
VAIALRRVRTAPGRAEPARLGESGRKPFEEMGYWKLSVVEAGGPPAGTYLALSTASGRVEIRNRNELGRRGGTVMTTRQALSTVLQGAAIRSAVTLGAAGVSHGVVTRLVRGK